MQVSQTTTLILIMLLSFESVLLLELYQVSVEGGTHSSVSKFQFRATELSFHKIWFQRVSSEYTNYFFYSSFIAKVATKKKVT